MIIAVLLGCGPGLDVPGNDDSSRGPDLALDQALPDAKLDSGSDSKDGKPDAPKPKPDTKPPPDLRSDVDPSKCEQIEAAAGAHVAGNRAHNCAGMASTCVPGEVNKVVNGLCACANGSNEIIGIAASPAKVTVHWFKGAKPLWHYYGSCP